MIKKFFIVILLTMSILFVGSVYGQRKQSKIAQDVSHFEKLKNEIGAYTEDSLKLQIAEKALQKAKTNRDTLAIANVYYFLSKIKTSKQNQYSDSIISITYKKNYIQYPALGYLVKGNINYELGDYKKALEYYLKGSISAKENGNEQLYFSLKFNIGLLKNTAGERAEAQQIFTEYLAYLDQNPKIKTPYNYNGTLFALADAYIYNKQLDSAKIYIDRGIIEALETKDESIYSILVVYSGMLHYFSDKYEVAIDSLQKGKRLIQNTDEVKTRTAICDYYLARCHQAMGNIDLSVHHFENVDSILKKTDDVIPELIDTYDHLINYYKSQKQVDKQLEYINTSLRFDSILHANQIYLTKNISKRYDTVELISEKEKLISQLEEDKFIKEEKITILSIFLGVLVLIAGYGFWRSYNNRKLFLEVLEKQKEKEKTKEQNIEEVIAAKPKEEIDIPEEVVTEVLKKLQSFENSAKFSKKHYTLNSLAKELDTNSAYLSKIINVYKHINFANYLNNLRIDFAIDQLTANNPLRSYTIKAIAEEVGFKNAQSFSTAFHKRTGIYPSYFIKKLKV
ncbi:helix-turn-helix domain-containing protein [Aquimarina sp. AU474]|uniref:helix-turn-helix domain-containing protein n=1 Tax=Aquimarina sp. AU474 TaxID=2108529 RepID=UPI000D6884D2|nr:helix-turn-helix domain-containing protein [Aquimarina sp. AU474]